MDTKPEVKRLAELLEMSEGEAARLIHGPRLGVKEVAAHLKMAESTAYGLIKNGELFGFKIGGRVWVPEHIVVNYLARQILKASIDNGAEI